MLRSGARWTPRSRTRGEVIPSGCAIRTPQPPLYINRMCIGAGHWPRHTALSTRLHSLAQLPCVRLIPVDCRRRVVSSCCARIAKRLDLAETTGPLRDPVRMRHSYARWQWRGWSALVQRIDHDRVQHCPVPSFKPGREQEFLDAHKNAQANWLGLKQANMVMTGDRTYCIVAEWTDMDALAKARPNMIAALEFLPRHARMISAVALVSLIRYQVRWFWS